MYRQAGFWIQADLDVAGEHLRIGETVPPSIAMLSDEHRKYLGIQPLEDAVALITAAPAVSGPQHHVRASDFAHFRLDLFKAVVHIPTAFFEFVIKHSHKSAILSGIPYSGTTHNIHYLCIIIYL
jgi:hypothetical protein